MPLRVIPLLLAAASPAISRAAAHVDQTCDTIGDCKGSGDTSLLALEASRGGRRELNIQEGHHDEHNNDKNHYDKYNHDKNRGDGFAAGPTAAGGETKKTSTMSDSSSTSPKRKVEESTGADRKRAALNNANTDADLAASASASAPSRGSYWPNSLSRSTFGLNDARQDQRSFTGFGNNKKHPALGATGSLLGRATPPEYSGDGRGGEPARAGAPSARAVSNSVCKWTLPGAPPADGELSDMFWVFGQLIDHVLALTEAGEESFAISVLDDAIPDMAFHRSDHVDDVRGVRQQANELSGFLDGSTVYGHNEARANALRTFRDGRLRTSYADNGEVLLPNNNQGLPNAGNGIPFDEQFLAGDIRSNEHALLTGIHVVFVREHNRWATKIALERIDVDVAPADNARQRDERIYQKARSIVTAEMQAILYEEWLPLLLGPTFAQTHTYTGYKPSTSATVSTEFSTVAFRIGHTMVSEDLATDRSGSTQPLLNLFFKPGFVRKAGVDNLLLGATNKAMQTIDRFVVEALRTLLFQPTRPDIADLAAFNIQRGRDHGVANYNDLRAAYGLEPRTLEDLGEPFVVYDALKDVDPWAAGLAEPPAQGSRVGETFWAVLADQFARSRDGDRFYYEHDPSLKSLHPLIKETKMHDILNRNTVVGEHPVWDAFRVTPEHHQRVHQP